MDESDGVVRIEVLMSCREVVGTVSGMGTSSAYKPCFCTSPRQAIFGRELVDESWITAIVRSCPKLAVLAIEIFFNRIHSQ